MSRNIKEIWDNSDLETPENDICENNQESLPMAQSYMWAFGDKKARGICFEDVVIKWGEKKSSGKSSGRGNVQQVRWEHEGSWLGFAFFSKQRAIHMQQLGKAYLLSRGLEEQGLVGQDSIVYTLFVYKLFVNFNFDQNHYCKFCKISFWKQIVKIIERDPYGSTETQHEFIQ